MNTVPCRGCTDREYLCHSSCQKYLAFKDFKDKVRQRMQKENDLNHAVVESIERLHKAKNLKYSKRNAIW
jgi:hypothetical protein